MSSVRGPNLGRTEPHKRTCSVCGFQGIDTRIQRIGGAKTDTGSVNGVAFLITTAVNADALGVTDVARADVPSVTLCPSCGTNNWIEGSNRALAI